MALSYKPTPDLAFIGHDEAIANWDLQQKIIKGDLSLRDFFYNIYSQSFPDSKPFVGGPYIDAVIERLENNNRLIEIAPRGHAKSERAYGVSTHSALTTKTDMEALYISASSFTAKRHVRLINDRINNNPRFDQLKNNKVTAETLISTTNSFGAKFNMYSGGIMKRLRGFHVDLLIMDDVFYDENKEALDSSQILKANDMIRGVFLPMIKPGGKFIMIGTPLSRDDFLMTAPRSHFNVFRQPAIVDAKKKQMLWPELYDWNWAEEKRGEVGESKWAIEYMLEPAVEANSYITRRSLDAVINKDLEEFKEKEYKGPTTVLAGLDIGQSVHPSHFCVFEIVDGKAIQLLSEFWRDMNYIDQLNKVKAYCINLGITHFYYDDGGREFRPFRDTKKYPQYSDLHLPDVAHGLMPTAKSKPRWASNFRILVERGQVELLPDEDQKNSILSVDSNLDVLATRKNHGDAFWSIALALSQMTKIVDSKDGGLTDIYAPDTPPMRF